jgi:ATP-dependent RNA helicase DeaD
MKFEELGLTDKTLAALQKIGYNEPTEVQAKTIPEIIAGKNLLVRSQTGTGKTAAFGIGLIERIAAGKSKKALVLTPTRELAVQVCEEIKNIGQLNTINAQVVYGGQSIENQIHHLRSGVDILVATPGRLLDLSRRGAVRINEFDIIVLDEADMMLDMGFIDEVGEILDQLPQQRLSILLSATLEPEILEMAHKYVKNPKTVEIGQKEVAETVVEEYVEATDREKFSHLVAICKSHAHMKILIFRETKMGSDRLQQRLWERGFKVGVLQGDMSQAKRNSVLAAFKEGLISVLVATNVAARGLHIDDLGLVVNYDKAQTEEIHLHRVGRTGRMSSEGKAITFVTRPESRSERMSHDHPDFAWMRQGGLDSYRSGADRGRGPPLRRGPPMHRPRREGANEFGSGIPDRRESFGQRTERGPRREGPRREGHEHAPRPRVEHAPRSSEAVPREARPESRAPVHRQHVPHQEAPREVYERKAHAPSHRYMPYETEKHPAQETYGPKHERLPSYMHKREPGEHQERPEPPAGRGESKEHAHRRKRLKPFSHHSR